MIDCPYQPQISFPTAVQSRISREVDWRENFNIRYQYRMRHVTERVNQAATCAQLAIYDSFIHASRFALRIQSL
jgi:hypothetical protein